MASHRLSPLGLVKVKQAIAEKGWAISSDRWLVEASRTVDPAGQWQESGPYAYGCSRQTWERFLQGKAIRNDSFQVFCQILSLVPTEVRQSSAPRQEDWGDVPDVPVLHGRQTELALLENWLLDVRYRLVAITGLAGMGKTQLAASLGRKNLLSDLSARLRKDFDMIVWRRVNEDTRLDELLTGLMQQVFDQQTAPTAQSLSALVSQLIQGLRQRRCLLILDGLEWVQQTQCSNCSLLLRRLAETQHRSCLLIASRIVPSEAEMMEGIWPVRVLRLRGIDETAGRSLVEDIGQVHNVAMAGTDQDWQALHELYAGHPLTLGIAARQIARQFGGQVRAFLQQSSPLFGAIADQIDWHFHCLSDVERTVLYGLAIHQTPVTLMDLQATGAPRVPEVLDKIERYIPLERKGENITLSPLMMTYVTRHFVQQVVNDLKAGHLRLLHSHALVQPSASDRVKVKQIRAVLDPIAEELRRSLPAGDSLTSWLRQHLGSQTHSGHLSNNIASLINYSQLNQGDIDFSDLTVWQAPIQVKAQTGTTPEPVDFLPFAAVVALCFRGDSRSQDDTPRLNFQQVQSWQQLEGVAKQIWFSAIALSSAITPEPETIVASNQAEQTDNSP